MDGNRVCITWDAGFWSKRVEQCPGDPIELPDVSGVVKPGYELEGWYSLPDGLGDRISSSTRVGESNDTFYAKWSASEMEVNFRDDHPDATVRFWLRGEGGASHPICTIHVPYGSTAESFPDSPTRQGCTFQGWIDSEGHRIGTQTIILDDMDCYAVFQPISYSISFTHHPDMHGRFADTDVLPSSYTIGLAEDYVPPSPVPDYGWQWRGWTPAMIEAGHTGDVEFVGAWERVEYIVEFRDGLDNAGVGETIDARTLPYQSPVGELPPPLDVDGKTFAGWFSRPLGAGERIVPSTSVTGDVVCYAHWVVHMVTVSFEYCNGGLGDGTPSPPTTVQVEYGHPLTASQMPLPLARPMQVFVGWYDSQSGGNELTASTPMVRDTVFYARYRNETCIVSWNANGGHFASIQQTLPIGCTIVPPVPSREGYGFVGWYDSDAPDARRLEEGDTLEATASYVARWVEDPITITFNSNGGH